MENMAEGNGEGVGGVRGKVRLGQCNVESQHASNLSFGRSAVARHGALDGGGGILVDGDAARGRTEKGDAPSLADGKGRTDVAGDEGVLYGDLIGAELLEKSIKLVTETQESLDQRIAAGHLKDADAGDDHGPIGLVQVNGAIPRNVGAGVNAENTHRGHTFLGP
jgi:hypothetical protein